MLKIFISSLLLFMNIFFSNSLLLIEFFYNFTVSVLFIFIIKLFIILMDIISSISTYLDISDFIAVLLMGIQIRLILENKLTLIYLSNINTIYGKIKLKLMGFILFLFKK